MLNKDFNFYVKPEIHKLGIKVTGIVVKGLKNQKENIHFTTWKQTILKNLQKKYSKNFIKEDNIIQGFRQLHNRIGYSNKKFISSPESLINYFLKKGEIPSINLIVDIYNFVSLETNLSLGAHELEKIHGNVTFRITNGTEFFVPLGTTKKKQIKAGEYCYIDDSNEVICRLECRQSEKTKITLESENCLFIVQGNEYTSDEYILSAIDKLLHLIKKYCGGQAKILSELS